MGTKYRVAEKLLSFGRGKCCAVAPTGSECSIVAMLLPGQAGQISLSEIWLNHNRDPSPLFL